MSDCCTHDHPYGTGYSCTACLDERIAAVQAERDNLLLQVDELRKHLDKLVAEGNRCLEIPEFWDDGLSDALDEAITYLDGTEKPITEKRVDEIPCYKCGEPIPCEDHGKRCAKCGKINPSVTTATFNNKGEFRGKLLCSKCDVSESLGG